MAKLLEFTVLLELYMQVRIGSYEEKGSQTIKKSRDFHLLINMYLLKDNGA